jgi:hypothetical protein
MTRRTGDPGRSRRREGGFILFLAVVLLTFLAAMAFAFARLVRADATVSGHCGAGAQAWYVASSGLERAYYNLYRGAIGNHVWTENRSYRPSPGAFTGGLYSCRIVSSEDTAGRSPTFGDLRILASASLGAYGEVRGTHTLAAAIANLANDSDGNPVTPPLVEASSDDGAHPARLAGDGDLTTAWTAAIRATATAPQWWSVAFASPEKVRKVQVVCPDARIRAYEIQFEGNGWKPVGHPATASATRAGRRTISVAFDEVTTGALRIHITDARQPARILEFKAYPPPSGARLSEPGS